MGAYYGIDLGTTQCLVAQFWRNPITEEDELTCLINPRTGEIELPSVVSFLSDSQYVTGMDALSRLYKVPDSTVELVKVRLGNTKTIPVVIPGSGKVEKSPQEIASLLLKSLKETRGAQIDSALLTVPAFFNQSQREATKQAGTLAGIDTENQIMIEEPTAAIIYQIYEEYRLNGDTFLKDLKKGENILVFDFGGGTLDLSIVKVSCNEDAVESEVLDHGGDPNLGGNVIDFLLTGFILRKLNKKYPKDPDVREAAEAFKPYLERYLRDHVLRFDEGVSDHVKQNIFITKRYAEECKIRLTDAESVKVRSPFPKCEPFDLSRHDFEIAVLNNEKLNLRERIEDTLDQIAEKGVPLHRVLLVGGSSQIPYIREIIRKAFDSFGIVDEKITPSHNCMRAVVLGAAIQQALRKGESVMPFRNNYCRNIVARDILLGCGKDQLKLFVKSGKVYPFAQDEEEMIVIPHALSENVSFALYERIREGKEETNRLISTYEYYLPLYYTGEMIFVHLNIGDDGLYQVSAVYAPTHEKVYFETKKENMLTDQQMDRAEKRVASMNLA